MRIITRKQERYQTGAKWAEVNPVLREGEIGWDTTLDNFKMGDGATNWSSLPYRLPIVQTSTPAVAPAGSVWIKPT